MRTIVYWYPAPTDVPRGLPVGRQWALPEALSRHVPVVLLSSKASDALRVIQVTDCLTLVQGAFRRFEHARPKVKRFASSFDRNELRKCFVEFGIHDFVFWLSWADVRYFGLRPGRRNFVYDCIDPGLSGSEKAHERHEKAVCEAAQGTFATAALLLERVQPWSGAVASLPNGCSDLGQLPPRQQTGRPIAGFLGTIDRRVSVPHLAEAARRLRSVDFLIGGRVNADRAKEVAPLARLDNVRMLGPVPEQSGQVLLESFDVGLVPFIEGPIGDSINPVKMYTYLERGLPVVASDIRECRGVPHVTVASSPTEFADAIEASLLEPVSRKAQRREFALSQTWDHRALSAFERLGEWGLIC